MLLNPVAFNRHLDHIGQSFLWRKSYACPCIEKHTYAPKADCPRCFGKGMFWPGEAVPAKSGVASQQVQQKWAKSGRWEEGDLVLSIPGSSPLWNLGRNDRVTSLNASDVFSDSRVRGDADEYFRFVVDSVDRVFWFETEGGPMVVGKAPVFDDNGVPSWPTGGGPPMGVQYSITGTKRLEFYVYDQLPRNRSEHHGARLPKNAVLRRFDMLGRGAEASSQASVL